MRDPAPPASPRPVIQSLQVFRGAAALAVLFYHVSLQFQLGWPAVPVAGAFHGLSRLGHLGVDFFFVLSGFIIHHIHAGDLGRPERAPAYLRKRFIRIWPLMAVIVAVKILYLLALRPADLTFQEVANNLLLLPGPKLVAVSWTLTFEALFYLGFLGAILLGRRFGLAVGATWAGLILVGTWVGVGRAGEPLSTVASPYVLQFMMGLLMAERLRRQPAPAAGRAGWGLPLAAVLLLGAGAVTAPFNATPREWTGPGEVLAGRLYWGVGFSLLVLAGARLDAWFRGPLVRAGVFLGNASYAIYLFHNEFITFLMVVLKRVAEPAWLGGWAGPAGVLLVTLAATLAVHVGIELPLLRRLRPARGGQAAGAG
jgi:peptidoglycan/LPS O-acetylase OafA/YrhL